ncbi:MAG: AarF/UbiB family protein [Methylococcaceae bacterium]|nr:AarF/UbiB family protein [Methylococcaceae bacterium]
MLWEFLNAAKDIGRMQDIATVLIRYGFGGFVQLLGLERVLAHVGKSLHWQHAEEYATLDTPCRVRHILEELGPTFIKMGQILATRVDLFPPAYIAEFEKLLDQVPPLPFAELLPQLEEDIGGSVTDIFQEIDTQPLAAASLAQVHRAVLKNGTPVVLKIRRPGIRKIIEADLHLLDRLVDIVESDAPELRRYHPREVVRQFSQSLRRELDFAAESRNAERVAANLAGDPHIMIPKVYWEFTGERLNVQEYVDGILGKDLDGVKNAGLDKRLLAERGVKAVLQMIMVDGFFHADPHPGNVFYLPDNRLAFIDFGMMGRLTDERREQVVSFLYGMVNHHAATVVEILEDWSDIVKTDTQTTLVVEIDGFVEHYSSLALKDLSLPMMIGDLMVILRDHNLSLPPDLALLIKAYITLDGFGRYLEPEFNTLNFSAPIIQKLMEDRYKPEAIAKRGWRNLVVVAELLSALPKELHQLLRASRKGTIQVDINVRGLDRHINKLNGAITRLTMGIVTAALIIGTSIIMTVKSGPTILGMPVFGFIGFLSASIVGVWLLISIWRGRKTD